MPRTKQNGKSKQNRESLEEADLFLKDFQKKAKLRINKLENETKFRIKSYETYHNLKEAGIPEELKQETLGKYFTWKEDDRENYNEATASGNDHCVSATVKGKETSKRGTATSDDGYVTEGTTATSTSRISHASRARKLVSEDKPRRVTRSCSNNRRSALADITYKTSYTKSDKYKTPAPSKTAKNEYNLITPKVKPNTPMNILRRPREGEMVLSMQGSPLLVSAINPDKTANINVPLSNGNVMSLLPNDGLRMSNIPALDPETMRQLETLKDHIEKVIALK